MALIDKEVIPPKKEHLTARIDPDLLQTLNHYCRFIQSSQNYVIEQSLRYMFAKDRDFQLWMNTQGATEEESSHAKTGKGE